MFAVHDMHLGEDVTVCDVMDTELHAKWTAAWLRLTLSKNTSATTTSSTSSSSTLTPCARPLLPPRFEEHDREIAVLDFSHDDRLLATVDIDK
jgi:hypothetical protein